jgi:hypothetical protein
MAFDEHNWLLVIEENSWVEELFAQSQDLIGRRALVLGRFVIAGREGHKELRVES